MIPLQREILGLQRRYSRDVLSQCLVCGAFTWSNDLQERADCRCYSGWPTAKGAPEIRLLSESLRG